MQIQIQIQILGERAPAECLQHAAPLQYTNTYTNTNTNTNTDIKTDANTDTNTNTECKCAHTTGLRPPLPTAAYSSPPPLSTVTAAVQIFTSSKLVSLAQECGLALVNLKLALLAPSQYSNLSPRCGVITSSNESSDSAKLFYEHSSSPYWSVCIKCICSSTITTFLSVSSFRWTQVGHLLTPKPPLIHTIAIQPLHQYFQYCRPTSSIYDNFCRAVAQCQTSVSFIEA